MKEYYRPLPDGLTIKENKKLSKKTGRYELGLYTNRVIYQDEYLGITHHNVNATDEVDIIRTPLGGFINHSETPNCKIIKVSEHHDTYQLLTIREIYPEEELTIKYNLYDPTKS
jgi:SET domain-containing protein